MRGDNKEVDRIYTQQETMSPEAQQLLKQGINLVKVKPALKDLLNAILVDQALSGERGHIAIHWSIHAPLQNWLRAEFPKHPVMSWPWGNWWQVRVTGKFDEVIQKSDITIHNLVIR